jgi:hypothetical protein
MFFYITHNAGKIMWTKCDEGARNVRVFIFGAVMYILFHCFLYSKYLNTHQMVSMYKNYFWWLLAIDIVAVGVLYKIAYKNSILNEVTEFFVGKKDKVIDIKENIKILSEEKEKEKPKSSIFNMMPNLDFINKIGSSFMKNQVQDLITRQSTTNNLSNATNLPNTQSVGIGSDLESQSPKSNLLNSEINLTTLDNFKIQKYDNDSCEKSGFELKDIIVQNPNQNMFMSSTIIVADMSDIPLYQGINDAEKIVVIDDDSNNDSNSDGNSNSANNKNINAALIAEPINNVKEKEIQEIEDVENVQNALDIKSTHSKDSKSSIESNHKKSV